MKILSIETSCDETSIAVLQAEKDGGFSILSNIVSSQVKIHAPFGGVVPMLARREHQKNLVPILTQALKESRLNILTSQVETTCDVAKLKIILEREPELLKKLLPFLKKYQKPNIDLIAVTNGPGLEPALWVGVNFAKAIACFWHLPVIPVNHVEAHITANWLEPIRGKPKTPARGEARQGRQNTISKQIAFPAISLIVSGGHTQLVLMRDFGQYKILGETRDDAAGEAFDKLAKMLNLGYPGGPIVSKLAQSFDFVSRDDLRNRQIIDIKLPRPMLNSPDYDFSFSGLKTAALYFIKTLDKKTLKKITPAICAEFQQAAIDVLVSKTIRAAQEYNVKSVLLSGGVAANDLLRNTLEKESKNKGFKFGVPKKEFCTDNAAMIALTAFYVSKRQYPINWNKLAVNANLRIT